MRFKNLFIIVAIVAAIMLAIQYIRQVHRLKRGVRRVSGGGVFFNWLMAIILVGSLVGIGVTSFSSHQEASSKPTKISKPKKMRTSTSDDREVTLSFKHMVHLNANGSVKVKFMVSPGTKVVIRGHRSGEVFRTIKTHTGGEIVAKTVTFNIPGTYDITATRGREKVVKKLQVKEQKEKQSSESSSSSTNSSSSSQSSSSSSSAHSASATSHSSSNSNNNTANTNANNSTSGSGSSQRSGGNTSGSNGGSSYRGGGNGNNSYRGGGSNYRPSYGGNGGASRPAISNQPNGSISNQPG